MSKQLKRILLSMFLFLLFCFGISLQIKANIGQSTLNAFALTVASLFNSKIGTILNITNAAFWIVNCSLKKFKLDSKDIIQIISTFANGFVINYFVYSVLNSYNPSSYILQILTFIGGIMLSSTSLGVMLAIGIISFPLEGFCITLGKLLNKSLTQVRLFIDTFYLISVFILSIAFNIPLYIREGTIISYFLLSFLMGTVYKWYQTIQSR